MLKNNNNLSPVNNVDHCFFHFAIFVTSLKTER